MGVKTVTTIVVCIFVMGGLLICFWGDLDKLRNLVLIVGAPLAIGLAVWRSIVAQKQAEVAQEGLLSNRHQRAVEMLGHKFTSVRIGGIRALRDLAVEHNEYKREVLTLLNLYAQGANKVIMIQDTEEENKTYPADEWEAKEASRLLRGEKNRSLL